MDVAHDLELDDDRYLIERTLGRGGMGVVYLVLDRHSGEKVALKLLSGRGSMNLVQFKREFRAAKRLDHPNCLRVFDFHTDPRRAWFTMEYVAGGALPSGRRCDLPFVADIAVQALHALDHLHGKQIVHGDLKHGNLLIETRDGRRLLKLADFGIAQMGERTAALGTFQGSLAFVSPEQAGGDPATPRSDLYALGVILYELLSGRYPISTSGTTSAASRLQLVRDTPVVPLETHRPDLPEAVCDFVAGLLEKDPTRRFATAAAAHDAVMAWTAGTIDVPTPPVPLLRTPHLAVPSVVGRKGELEAIDRLLAQNLSGARRTTPKVGATLVAPAGVGKSRLAAEVARRAQALGAEVQAATCRPELGQPYAVVRELVKGVRRSAVPHTHDAPTDRPVSRDDGGATYDPAFTFATRHDDEDALVTRSLEAAPKAGSRSAEAMSGQHWQFLRDVWNELSTRTREQPLLIIVDDCQWADAASLDLLLFLARSLRRAAVGPTPVRAMLLLTARPSPTPPVLAGLHDELGRASAWTRFELAPLSAQETTDYLAQSLVVQASILPERFAASLHERTEGNPLYLRRVLATLLQHHRIFDERGAWTFPEDLLDDVALPRSLHGAIDDQIARLATATVETLVAASVLGRTFQLGDLQRVTGLDEPLLLDCLDEAIRGEFVEETDGFVFAHDRLRDALLDRITDDTRRRLHHKAASVMVERAREAPAFASLAAHHLDAAGEPEEALPFAIRAADHAMSVHAYRRASEAFELAVRLAADAGAALPEDVIEGLGDAALQAGRYDLAREQFSALLDAATQPMRRAALLNKLADTQLRAGNTVDARELMERLLAQVGFPPPSSRVGILLGTVRLVAKFLLAAAMPRWFTRDRLADAPEVHDLVSRMGARLAEAYYWSDFDRSGYFQFLSMDAAEQVGPSATLSQAAAQQGYILSSFGVRGLATSYLVRARKLADAYGAPTEQAWEAIMRAMSYACAGNVQGNLDEAQRAVELVAQSLEPLRMAQAWWILGEANLAANHPRVAEGVAHELITASVELGVERNRGWGLLIQGLAQQRQGRDVDALATLAEAVVVCNASGDVSTAMTAAARWSIALAMAGDTERGLTEAVNTAVDWHARKLRHITCVVDGAVLVAASLHRLAGGRLTAEQEATRARCSRVGDAYSRCHRYTRPAWLVGRAAWTVAETGSTDPLLAALQVVRSEGPPGELLDMLWVAQRVSAGRPEVAASLGAEAEALRTSANHV